MVRKLHRWVDPQQIELPDSTNFSKQSIIVILFSGLNSGDYNEITILLIYTYVTDEWNEYQGIYKWTIAWFL